MPSTYIKMNYKGKGHPVTCHWRGGGDVELYPRLISDLYWGGNQRDALEALSPGNRPNTH